ncbi:MULTISPECIES: glutamate racemase [Pseudoalteromonas]|uniref:Glutamate racemase n=1 Tax=Pseudoalteromonas amylolytica TaxID=1859457 RepID=A0A1S1MPT6_9GAMM|nr:MULTISPECIES: glutamate racemase [Pseudoalteromonas]OHU86883.1 glutamate racemase [Pseudoalteromonas amylolytica]OHU89458.1 glutamate racemase [Pseudoalteromonas sp. JW3]
MPHILVFDSGVGGTSVLSHIQSLLPTAQYSYVMDNALLPYGLQSEQTIQSRLACLIKRINDFEHVVDLIVIACNTASTQALAATRKLTSIPIVGVVPAIKPAAAQSKSRRIALLATPATSNNAYTNSLIAEHAKGCRVDLHKSTRLVALAEQYYWQQTLDLDKLAHELEYINIDKEVDCIVLGCTHFPILRTQLEKFYGSHVDLIDSGHAIAKRVQFLLEGKQSNRSGVKMPLQFFATAPSGMTNKEGVTCRAIDLNC